MHTKFHYYYIPTNKMALNPKTINKRFPQQRASITPSAKSSRSNNKSKFKPGPSVGSLGGQKPVVYNLERSPAETHLLRRSSQVRRESAIYGIRNGLAPSYNPVRRSITSATDIISKRGDFVVHYNRKLHSQVTIDSKHEDFYKQHGLPLKPKYNPDGRRFSESSDTDPDYDHEAFKKLTQDLNNRKSVEDRKSDGSGADEKRRSSNKGDQDDSNKNQSAKPQVERHKVSPDPYIKLKPIAAGESRYHKRRLQSMSVSSRSSAKQQSFVVACLKSIFCCVKGRRSQAVHPNRMGSQPSTETSVIILEPSSTSDTTNASMSSAITTETSVPMSSEVLFPGRLQQQRISLTVTPSSLTTTDMTVF